MTFPVLSSHTALNDRLRVADVPSLAAHGDAAPSMEVFLLSPFRVSAGERRIDDWPPGRGPSIFKYLVLHRSQPVARDVLMDVFWPGAPADAARNRLNVALYGLRRALAPAEPGFDFVRHRQGRYGLHPGLRLWVDAEAFVAHVQRAQVAEQCGDAATAIAEYRVAQALHHQPLLKDDRYEDWLIPHRLGLQTQYLRVLEKLRTFAFEQGDLEGCITVTQRMLELDRCDEDAHRVLMRCYGRLGHAHLALRQFHFCVDALARELNLIPSPQTVALFQQIRQRQAV